MNLELHGCVSISAANELCELGLVSPFTFAVSGSHAEALVFEAIETDLQAILEIAGLQLLRRRSIPSSPKPSRECKSTSSPQKSMWCSIKAIFHDAVLKCRKPRLRDRREAGDVRMPQAFRICRDDKEGDLSAASGLYRLLLDIGPLRGQNHI